ncbi:hypothetical protein JH271_20380 [Xanthomonas campestris pv. campestris]|uniref:AbiJ-NTD4 domain-containing protein n=1 Tax=Xanthomonas campestris TaxID=339 RepID=UPI0011C03773|nr:hypothetical protein [Xanthomonas campestris]MEA9844389.1 hypothetical protein [Xanthomonas campestris pv. raphani]WDK58365.1 hypothetical protein JH301_01025 [Xanthomonas campestris pv. campestris]WDK62733.1 hypothetical protein JH271_20380 [Xanthomonas campestris pv. campestris]WDK66769.1 hypothetical protein JH258_20400 [Xanthomonas campestris pv. campestris]WDK70649.1 hypothetical protein JH284_19580 [Xanthomonas campestris pv. campestris]
MSFSERIGLRPKSEIIQVNSMDAQLRSGLWDAIHICIFDKYVNLHDHSLANSNMKWLFRSIWHHYFHKPVDTLPYGFDECVKIIREHFFKSAWNRCYDLIDFIPNHCDEDWRSNFISFSNAVLERNLAGYRFIGLTLTPISSDLEVAEILSAISNPSINSGARSHLKAALALLSDRKEPDHRNSIKESISAVESICQQLTSNPKATLSDALKVLEKNGAIHLALKASFNSLYGYTSDADGIRHAMLDETNLTSVDSRYMLVTCSSFVNYLTEKVGR